MEAATWLYGSSRDAARNLGDPLVWARLRHAARRAFPNDPKRRLSKRAPSRHQHYRARQTYFCGEAFAALGRDLRREALRAATHMGMLDPARGSWTHPDTTQCIIGNATWIPAATNQHRRGPLAPDTGKPRARNRGTDIGYNTSDGPRKIPARVLVMLACRNSDSGGSIVLDAEPMPSDNSPDREVRSDADQAVEMLRRLLDENEDLLRPGLRGSTYDMAISSEAIDTVLDMRVLPITKTPRSACDGNRRASLGNHTFTAPDGTEHDHYVTAIGGSPAVVLTDSRGVEAAVPLRRQHIYWGHGGQQRNIAHCRYAMPDSPAIPKNLRGASTPIRLNSTNQEVHSRPHTRRTRALRAIPETDPSLAVFAIREDTESIFLSLRGLTAQ